MIRLLCFVYDIILFMPDWLKFGGSLSHCSFVTVPKHCLLPPSCVLDKTHSSTQIIVSCFWSL